MFAAAETETGTGSAALHRSKIPFISSKPLAEPVLFPALKP